MKRKPFNLLVLFLSPLFSQAQIYPPPAGQVGSTAIHKDSSIFSNWVTNCHIERGYMDISTPSLGYATAGDSSMALGKAMTNGIVSLGDGGSAICGFAFPIKNGPGFDFAVFENGFDDYFLELAFVEVSSDGINYFRFPSHSLTDTMTQTGSFDTTFAIKINNLAGKYRGGFGTPFDLQELSAQQGLNVNEVRYVKLVDVVGSITNSIASRDSYHNKVNDPWPTPFPSGGFDLDAIGVIHENKTVSLFEQKNDQGILIYPNPVAIDQVMHIDAGNEIKQITIIDVSGKELFHGNLQDFAVPQLEEGIYFLKIETTDTILYKRISVDSGN